MKKQMLLCVLIIYTALVYAQNNQDSAVITTVIPAAHNTKKDSIRQGPYLKNNIKMNLTSLAFNNYSFFYERSISRKISVQAGYRFMPKSNLGGMSLTNNIADIAGDDGDVINDLDGISLANNSATLEVRFYTGRKPGPRGFYVGLYGRYTAFNYDYDYAYETSTAEYPIPITGDAKGIGGGILLGTQFNIGKRVVVDIYLLGAHFGKLTGTGVGMANLSSLTADQKNDIQNEFESFQPTGSQIINATVTNGGVALKIDGPFAGVRALGLSVGFAF